MSLGARLKEERERLGLSQPKFAAVADTTKQTLFSWEAGKTAPDGFQLAALTVIGVDVQYIVTGEHSDMALTPDERELLALFRSAPLAGKAAAVGALQGVIGSAAPVAGRDIVVSGSGHRVAGRDLVEGKAGKK